jgi:hypothetical protein
MVPRLRIYVKKRQCHLTLNVLPVTLQGDEGIAFHGSRREELSDLGFAEQQLPDCFRLMILSISLGVLVDVSIMQKCLIVLNSGERIPDLPFAGAKRLDLRAPQHQAGFKSLQNMVIAARYRVCQNIRHKESARRDPFWLR